MSAAIVGDTDIVWERGFGRQDLGPAIPTQPDTPFHIDGLGQTLTATLVLQCVEQGKLSLDDPVGNYDSASADPGATIRQLLAHTSPGPAGETFSYRPERLESLRDAVRECTGDSYRETLANLFDRLAMKDSVPGPDAVTLAPPSEGIPDAATAARYSAVLARLTTSYLVSRTGAGEPVPALGHDAHHGQRRGLDRARSRAVRRRAQAGPAAHARDAGAGLEPAGRSRACRACRTGSGGSCRSYNGQLVVWQFGVSESSSSFLMTLPSRRLTMILLANSDGLVKPFVLAPGDVLASPFARVFLGLLGP